MHRVANTVAVESELQRALDCGELIPLYQPIVDVATGDVVAVETLLRWHHPARGLLAPVDFLLDEDDARLLVRIGWSVVIEAARRAGEWRRAYPQRPITVSVNLFDDHLERRELPTRVQQLIRDNEVPGPRPLAFEIGERHLVPGRSKARDRLTVLHNVGVDVVVDDFGAAAARGDADPGQLRDDALERLEMLAGFPLDVVKLDARFVRRLGGDGDDERVRDVVDAAHAIDVRVLAMAVEDDATAEAARRAGFDLGQGFHYEHPLRPSRIDDLLADR
jgi:EAL domain-containing protein (putative c-di-GMP-specific phosphodiesterase class I)